MVNCSLHWNKDVKDLAAECNLRRFSLSRSRVKHTGVTAITFSRKKLCILDRIEKHYYNYVVIDYGAIIESEALTWHLGIIHLMIRS